MRLNYFRGQAFSLIEITLALGVAAFALLAIYGLIPVGLNSNRDSVEQTAAASMARAIVADLRATPITTSTSSSYGITIPNTTELYLREDGSNDVTKGTYSRYLAYITFPVPPSPQPLGATVVRILITWPAGADLNNFKNGQPPTNYAGSYEVMTALDRH